MVEETELIPFAVRTTAKSKSYLFFAIESTLFHRKTAAQTG